MGYSPSLLNRYLIIVREKENSSYLNTLIVHRRACALILVHNDKIRPGWRIAFAKYIPNRIGYILRRLQFFHIAQ